MNVTEFWNDLFSKSRIATIFENQEYFVSQTDALSNSQFERISYPRKLASRESNESKILAGHKKSLMRARHNQLEKLKKHTQFSYFIPCITIFQKFNGCTSKSFSVHETKETPTRNAAI